MPGGILHVLPQHSDIERVVQSTTAAAGGEENHHHAN